MSDALVFSKDGVYRVPGLCELYWWYISRRDQLNALECWQEAAEMQQRIEQHLALCDDCRAFMDACEHGPKPEQQLGPEETAIAWARLGHCKEEVLT